MTKRAMQYIRAVLFITIITSLLLLSGCAMLSSQPKQIDDACAIFHEKGGWFHATKKAEQRWNIPSALILAFIRQESAFKADAKPPAKKLFGFIPWSRPSSAYGYPQATKPAWEDYLKASGRSSLASRSRYSDAVDFVAWYNDRSVRQLKLSRRDAYNLYLAYHEGLSAYRKKSYLKKQWLLGVAKKVERYYKAYTKQLKQCEKDIDTRWYQKIFVEQKAREAIAKH